MFEVIRGWLESVAVTVVLMQEDGVCDPDTFTQAVTSWTTELQDNLKQVDTYVPQVMVAYVS